MFFVRRLCSKVNRLVLHIDGSVYLLLAFMLLLLPLPWMIAMIIAILVHECFHAAAISVLGGSVFSIHVGAQGIRMETDALSSGKEIICAVAGPIGSALLILLSPRMPRIAICGAFHCIYNLLPLFPMDGGRILRSILMLCLPQERGGRVFAVLQNTFRFIVVVLCCWCCWRFGLLLLPVTALFLLRTGKRENCLTTGRFGSTIAS